MESPTCLEVRTSCWEIFRGWGGALRWGTGAEVLLSLPCAHRGREKSHHWVSAGSDTRYPFTWHWGQGHPGTNHLSEALSPDSEPCCLPTRATRALRGACALLTSRCASLEILLV